MDFSFISDFFNKYKTSSFVWKSLFSSIGIGAPIVAVASINLEEEGLKKEKNTYPSTLVKSSSTNPGFSSSEPRKETLRDLFSKNKTFIEKDDYRTWRSVIEAYTLSKSNVMIDVYRKNCNKILSTLKEGLSQKEIRENEKYVDSYCVPPKTVKEKFSKMGIDIDKKMKKSYFLSFEAVNDIVFWHGVLMEAGYSHRTNNDKLKNWCTNFPQKKTKIGELTFSESNFIKYCFQK